VKPKILTFAGSARRDSLNKQLARIAADHATARGAEAAFIDLGDYKLPIYDGDLEQAHGIPANAVDLAELVDNADALFIASPEYNGAYTPLLKNTIDWVTRVDHRAFVRPTALGSATPGRMGVPVIAEQFALPHAAAVLKDGMLWDPAANRHLDSVVSSLIGSVDSVVAVAA
jgi:NAD(P)H-dependent FMN reductase